MDNNIFAKLSIEERGYAVWMLGRMEEERILQENALLSMRRNIFKMFLLGMFRWRQTLAEKKLSQFVTETKRLVEIFTSKFDPLTRENIEKLIYDFEDASIAEWDRALETSNPLPWDYPDQRMKLLREWLSHAHPRGDPPTP